jgi:acyl carrier protein
MVETAQKVNGALIEQIIDIVVREMLIDRDAITMDTRLDSLDVASADMVMVLMAIEEDLDVYIPVDGDIAEAETVGELINTLAQHIENERA